jgi:hypothetical protein
LAVAAGKSVKIEIASDLMMGASWLIAVMKMMAMLMCW